MADEKGLHGKAARAVRDTERQFDLFMHYLPGYAYVTDQDDRLVYANDQLQAQLGQDGSLVGRPEAELWPPVLAEQLQQAAHQVRHSEQPVDLPAELTVEAELRIFAVSKFLIPLQDNPPYLGTVFLDITDLARSKRAFADAESRFSLLMDHFPGFAFIKDEEGRFVYANQATRDFLQAYGGMDGPADCGRWPPDLAAGVIADDEAVRTTGQAVERAEEVPIEGGTRKYLTSKFPIPREGKPPLVGAISRDISAVDEAAAELAANQERLRALIAELSLTEERERRRLAGEIHDNLSQTLALARIKIQELGESVPTESLKTGLAEVRAFVDEAIANTRSVTFDLSPPILYQVGFEAALEWLGEQTRDRHKIAAHLENDNLPKPLSDEARAMLFQVVRELFANLIKHAQAQNVWVRLRRLDGMLEMQVEDDGVGFEPEKATWTAKETSGFGLFSIRERIAYLQGTIEIASAIGQGTRVTVCVPLSAECEQSPGGD